MWYFTFAFMPCTGKTRISGLPRSLWSLATTIKGSFIKLLVLNDYKFLNLWVQSIFQEFLSSLYGLAIPD